MPLKPRNLNPDEVRAEHVKLSWDPPLDDGGTPITGYLVRYMDIDSGEWATACTTSSCNATAKGLKPGHLYQFEVSAINKEGQSEPILTTDPILAENPYSTFHLFKDAPFLEKDAAFLTYECCFFGIDDNKSHFRTTWTSW